MEKLLDTFSCFFLSLSHYLAENQNNKMKNSILFIACCIILVLTSCKSESPVAPPVITPNSSIDAPDCIQALIIDLQENDPWSDCLSSIRSYLFEGETVYGVQDSACSDGPLTILNETCDTICVLNAFASVLECGDSPNFFEETEFIELIWEEED